jgi:protocatechuate 3,4-dioxygenase beta subunit
MEEGRLGEVVRRLTSDLHQAISDLGITEEELWIGLRYLNEVGQAGEFPLLSDVLEVSILVDGITHGSDPDSTASNVEGPFYRPGAPLLPPPFALAALEETGEPLFVSGVVRSSSTGEPLAGALLDVWHANAAGRYSNEDESLDDFHLRGVIPCDAGGRYEFRTVVPPPYEIPKEGPVGRLLRGLDRHAFRPAHLHVKATCDGYRPLTTMVFFEGDQWLASDVIGAVKGSLVARLKRYTDPHQARSAEPEAAAATFDISLAPQP